MATETVRAATVACASDDMNQRTEHEHHATNLRAAWESTDPEWLHDAVMSAATFLDELAQIEHQTVKGPLPGQEIRLEDLDALPHGAVFADNAGDLWVREATGWYCYERLSGLIPEEDFQPFIYQAQI